jgi:hypothetical protein
MTSKSVCLDIKRTVYIGPPKEIYLSHAADTFSIGCVQLCPNIGLALAILLYIAQAKPVLQWQRLAIWNSSRGPYMAKIRLLP